MILDDIKDRVSEQFQNAWARLQESSSYNKVRDRYDSLSPSGQKLAIGGVAFLVTLIILSIPLSYYDSASDSVATFEKKKSLIHDLFRVSRASSQLPPLPLVPSSSALVSSAQSQLQQVNVQPDQIKSVQEFDNTSNNPSPVIDKSVLQKGVEVKVAKLNLQQVVDLGYGLQTMTAGLKMVGLAVQASADDSHYYDVSYRLVAFSLPEEIKPLIKDTGKDGGKDKGKGGAGKGAAKPKPTEDQ